MHEMSITISMMDILREQMKKRKLERLKSVKVRVGELTAVEPGALSFCFGVCTEGTPLEGTTLEIEEVPYTGRCLDCGSEFHMEGFLQFCPSCEGCNVKELSGRELEIVSIETF